MVTVIRLQRPEVLNAVNTRMLDELTELFRQLAADPETKGVLLGGSGGHFAAGADLQEIRNFSPLEAIEYAEKGQSLCSLIESFPRPVLAATSGYVLGAGLELALACDYILAADTARFGFRELSYGVLPAFGGTQRLPRLVGKARAKEMLFTGQLWDVEQAETYGLVNRSFPEKDLFEQAVEQLREICGYGLWALQMGKEVIDTGYEINLGAACKMERDAFSVCFSTDDQKEGMTAFIQKREPKFTGK